MSKKKKMGKKATQESVKQKTPAPAPLSLGSKGKIVYLLRIIEEPEEPPIGLTQEDFDLILDHGSTLPPRGEAEEMDNKDFAFIETVKGKKFMYHGEPVKKKFVGEMFSVAMSSFIQDYVAKITTVTQENIVVKDSPNTDPLVEEVAEALFDSWFPNGHGGDTDEALREDWEAWREAAARDAVVAVNTMRWGRGNQKPANT
jgi:hypothetical protein